MSVERVKVYTEQLQLGMYVQELDRPWLESPFLFQGFMVDSEELLQQLQASCDYVYISVTSSLGDIRPHLLSLATAPPPRPAPVAAAPLPTSPEDERENFLAALRRSRKTYDKTKTYIDQALEDMRLGTAIDTEQARVLVSELAEHIVRSPNAVVWLTHLKNRDEYTSIHCINVCILSISFGRCLGLEKTELNDLGLGALLHDLGKMRVPLEILNKPARLTPDEYESMKQHPIYGYEMLCTHDNVPLAALDIIKHHHERKNGQGYPDRLEQARIPLLTQIVAIVDVYDAITSDRCYHDGIAPYHALNDIYHWAQQEFDLALVEKFIKCLGIYPIGSLVVLSTNETAVVLSASEKTRLRPVVMLVQDRQRQFYKQRSLLNLALPQWSSGPQAVKIQGIVPPEEQTIDLRRIIEEESRPVS
ncbi:MAG: HD-GYP domain-containing protein [Gammaproteobacteria bacterium]